jgi:hypothetical protein
MRYSLAPAQCAGLASANEHADQRIGIRPSKRAQFGKIGRHFKIALEARDLMCPLFPGVGLLGTEPHATDCWSVHGHLGRTATTSAEISSQADTNRLGNFSARRKPPTIASGTVW